jgi:undecaprenyl-diphosphatase
MTTEEHKLPAEELLNESRPPEEEPKLPPDPNVDPSQPQDDVPTHPWVSPSPEAKAAVEPAKHAVKKALREIHTPEQAEQVAEEMIAAAGTATEKQVREHEGAAPQPEQAIQAAATTPGTEKAPATLVEAAKQVAGSAGETREALEQTLQEAINPEQHGAVDPALQEPRDLLREAIIHHMKPYQAVDARLFLAVNHLPHPPQVNWFMYVVTAIMTGGFGWILGLIIAAVLNRKRGRQALLQTVPPLWFSTMTVEYPIKYYFRRRRPFIDIVQAISVGKKPGTYSFPSGHSAAAFAGAWLLSRHYPKLTALWYAIAALVGFSRVYLGAHYPGDVLSGALVGTLLAETTRWVIDEGDEVTEGNLFNIWTRKY